MTTLQIRSETERDIDAIARIVTAAFRDHPYSQQTEAAIIDGLRKAGALSISLVADWGGEIVGHVAFSPVQWSNGAANWYGLGPVAVDPARQRNGIGHALIQTGLVSLGLRGAAGCVLAGDSAYYHRFGFVRQPELTYPGVPPEYFLVLNLGAPIAPGAVTFHPAFDASAA